MNNNRFILIVEDEYIIREDLKQMVNSFGYSNVFTAADGPSAINLFLQVKPDVVLLDISLRNSKADEMNDGLSVAEWIRDRSSTPIIFVTALNDSKTLARASKLNPIAFVTKPLSESQLRTTVALTLTEFDQGNSPAVTRDRVFISYSHKDKRFLSSLQVHLKPLQRGGIDIWDDTLIIPGSDWRGQICEQIGRCRIAVLLVSANFLASEFIVENELPPLLKAAKRDGATILYVLLRPCKVPPELSHFQAVHSPGRAMSELSTSERDRVWMALAGWIEQVL